MRVNVYSEEITDRVEIISKTTEDGTFTGVRFYLELPISIPAASGHHVTHRGPFIQRPGDDDSSAVTFWARSGQELLKLLDAAGIQLRRRLPSSEGGYGAAKQTQTVGGETPRYLDQGQYETVSQDPRQR